MDHILQKKICVIMVAAVLLMVMSGCAQPQKAAVASEQQAVPVETEPARQWKDGLQTILVMVLDDFADSEASGGYRNGNRADFMMLMVVEEQLGKVTSVQLNPDTVVSFSAPGKSHTVEIPIGQVYSYGSGGSDSCVNIMKAVSQLFGGAPVDHYLTFTMDSLGIVSDMLGGITLIEPENESEEQSAEPLRGAEASAFFSSRSDSDVANEDHMQRQRQFMMSFYRPFMQRTQNEDFLTKLTLQLGDRMATDLTLSQLMLMFETLAAYEMDETILTVQGDAEAADGMFRFYADEASLNHISEVLFSK